MLSPRQFLLRWRARRPFRLIAPHDAHTPGHLTADTPDLNAISVATRGSFVAITRGSPVGTHKDTGLRFCATAPSHRGMDSEGAFTSATVGPASTSTFRRYRSSHGIGGGCCLNSPPAAGAMPAICGPGRIGGRDSGTAAGPVSGLKDMLAVFRVSQHADQHTVTAGNKFSAPQVFQDSVAFAP